MKSVVWLPDKLVILLKLITQKLTLRTVMAAQGLFCKKKKGGGCLWKFDFFRIYFTFYVFSISAANKMLQRLVGWTVSGYNKLWSERDGMFDIKLQNQPHIWLLTMFRDTSIWLSFALRYNCDTLFGLRSNYAVKWLSIVVLLIFLLLL